MVLTCEHAWSGPVQPLGLGVFALQYADLGYAVVPCERGGKRPHRMLAESGGVHWATTDPVTIRQWWSIDPAANIGVATGVTSALAVVDLDIKHENDGPGQWNMWLASHTFSMSSLRAESYPNVRTPSGGWHVWMRAKPGVAVPERPSFLPGVDVKGDGGLVIAPPSAQLWLPLDRDGERVEPVPVPYEWASGCPCMADSDWAPSGFLAELERSPVHGGPGFRDEPMDWHELARTGIPRGERNVTIYRLACGLFRENGTDPRGAAEVMRAVRLVWQSTPNSDFPWREVLTSVESARKFMIRVIDSEHRLYLMAAPLRARMARPQLQRPEEHRRGLERGR